ncbi:MAG: iduronate-2-sulfatase [Planctomycetota bacterium]|nr:MAG: iduronate-2-sulfatase [Planctomycetota bacterium]
MPAALAGAGAAWGLVSERVALLDAWQHVRSEAWIEQGLWRLTARQFDDPLQHTAVAIVIGAGVGLLASGLARTGTARRPRLVGGFALLAGGLACALLVLAVSSAWLSARRPPEHAPNVVFIAIDSLRADSLGCYGYERDTSPFLDELAATGVRFERALSQESYTLASVASYFTSTYPTTHQVLYDLPQIDTLRPTALTLAEVLADAGYATGAFVFNPHLQARYRFDQGFDVYDDNPKAPGVDKGTASWRAYETADFMQRKVNRFLERAPSDRPRFLYLHYRDVHGPYLPPPDYANRFVPDHWPKQLRARPLADAQRPAGEAPPMIRFVDYHRTQYDAEIAYTDDALRRLFTRLADRGLDRDNTLFVITSDHGEEFAEQHPGDTPSHSHGRTLYIEQIHVPLIVLLPGQSTPLVIREAVELLDVAPTVLDLARLPQPPSFAGRSLRVLAEGGSRPARALFSGGSRARGAVWLEDTVYIEEDLVDRKTRRFNARPAPDDVSRPHAELYELDVDPLQTENVLTPGDPRHETLRALLQTWRARSGESAPSVELDDDTREQLRALGYLGDER